MPATDGLASELFPGAAQRELRGDVGLSGATTQHCGGLGEQWLIFYIGI